MSGALSFATRRFYLSPRGAQRTAFFVFACLLVSLGGSRVGRAQSAEEPRAADSEKLSEVVAQATNCRGLESAKELFNEGIAQVKEGDYLAAVDCFLGADRIAPHPTVAYNLARAYQELGQLDAAIAYYERYLSQAQPLEPARRAEVANSLEQLRRLTPPASPPATQNLPARVRFDVRPLGARILLDGKRTEPAEAAAAVRPGAHQIVLSAPGHQTQTLSLEVAAGETAVVKIELIPALSAPAATSEPPTPTRGRLLSNLGLSLGAIGVGVLGTSLGLSLANNARYDRWSSQSEQIEALPEETAGLQALKRDSNDELAAIKRADLRLLAMGLSGGALLATGTTMAIIGIRSRRSQHARKLSKQHSKEGKLPKQAQGPGRPGGPVLQSGWAMRYETRMRHSWTVSLSSVKYRFVF